MKKYAVGLGIALVLAVSSVANADWSTFVIRGDATITENQTSPAPDSTTGWTLFDVSSSGEKAGWGTSDMNGQAVGDIASLSITRYVPESGNLTYAPYFNIWITDGAGEYAVIANEPSNTGEWGTGTPYDTTWDVLKDATAKIYEYNAAFSKPAGTSYTFADFAGYTIATPPSHWGSTGAPDDINAATYTAYGFNWVFGDTQSNYVGGHLAKNPTLVGSGNVPEPASFAIWALIACAGLVGARRRAK